MKVADSCAMAKRARVTIADLTQRAITFFPIESVQRACEPPVSQVALELYWRCGV
jgi:hypothetical protein